MTTKGNTEILTYKDTSKERRTKMAKGEEFVESYVMGGECPHMLPAYAPECGYKGECPYQGAGHYLPLCGWQEGQPLPALEDDEDDK